MIRTEDATEGAVRYWGRGFATCLGSGSFAEGRWTRYLGSVLVVSGSDLGQFRAKGKARGERGAAKVA